MINLKLIKDFYESRTKDFWFFEFSVWMHIFAASLVSVFIPIFLYEKGFSLSMIILYYFSFHLLNFFVNFIAERSTYTFGSKANIIFATFFNILFFYLLSLADSSLGFYYLLFLAILAAVYDAFYYVPSYYLFISSIKKEKNVRGSTSILSVVTGSASFLAPILGSFLVLFFGDSRAIYFVILFFILSALPLFKLKKIHTKPDHLPTSFGKFFSEDIEVSRFLNLFLFKTITGIEYFIFPLFVFITFGSLESVAVLAVLAPLVHMGFSIVSAKFDAKSEKNFLFISALSLISAFLIRLFADNDIYLYISTLLASVAFLIIGNIVDSSLFLGAKKRGPLATSTFKNALGMGGKALLFGFISLALYIFSSIDIFALSFWIGLVLSILLLIKVFFSKKI